MSSRKIINLYFLILTGQVYSAPVKKVCMKIFAPFIIILILLAACSKKEVPFELFSAEAFAYSLDEGYELNARTMVKGFKVTETDKKFLANLSYSVDLIMPDGNAKKNYDGGIIKKEEKEEFGEVEISIQKQMDSTYKLGKYKVVFKVADETTKKILTIEKDFDLTK